MFELDLILCNTCADPESFVRGDPIQIDNFFFWGGGGGGVYARRQFCDFQGNRTSIAKEPFICTIFQGGGFGLSVASPLDPRM